MYRKTGALVAVIGLFAITTLTTGRVVAGGDYGKKESANDKSIVETAAGDETFDTLVKCVTAAGLNETLAEKGPYTLFAPTDKAFDALPDGMLDELMKSENKGRLTQILTYHVVPAKVSAEKAHSMEKGTTMQGQSVHLTTQQNQLHVNGARVVESDIMASNGVIHAIDSVLMPSAKSDTGR